MGIPTPEKPLDEAVEQAAHNAAFEDPRFPPLGPGEPGEVVFEVTVLTPPEEIAPEEVQVGVHGLIIESRGRTGLLLPQVPEEQGWDREQYLKGVSRKAGLPPKAWRDASLQGFRGQVFKEREPRGEVEEV